MWKISVISGIIILYLVTSSIGVITSGGFSEIRDTKHMVIEAKRLYPEISDISTSLILSLIEVESSYISTAIGSVGEVGLMQVKPSTYQWIMDVYKIEHNSDISDRFNNIVAGMHYLKWLTERLNSTFKVLQAYNVGLRGLREGRSAVFYASRIYTGSFKYLLI
jgi:soluble lytic murein transglycosylase-like protein